MNIFTQLVVIVGRVTQQGVNMLGTGFIVSNDGKFVTTSHVVGADEKNLVVLAPHIKNINDYQDLSDLRAQPVKAKILEIHPIRDIAILEASDITYHGNLPKPGGFDDDNVGDEVAIFGFPHCVEGRRALTFQKTEIGAKVMLNEGGIDSKHAVINTQARPGQSGSMIFSPKDQSVSGLLMGAWIPAGGGMSLGGVNPRELHQTTHCISFEHVSEML